MDFTDFWLFKHFMHVPSSGQVVQALTFSNFSTGSTICFFTDGDVSR
jgi:hypothetical protein